MGSVSSTPTNSRRTEVYTTFQSFQPKLQRYANQGDDWYDVIRKLGSGGFGTVRLCRIKSSGELIAMKEISDQGNPIGTLDTLRTLYQQEKIMVGLDHRNIIEFLGYEYNNVKFRVYLEYAQKGSLRSCYKSDGRPFTDSQAGKYTRDILHGLQYLHGKNIIHHDIKCDNVLLFDSGVVKLADFGLVGQLKDQQSLFSPAGGTECFIAPEVSAGQRHNFSADIWSLGVTVIEMKIANYPEYRKEYYYTNFQFSREVINFVNSCLQENPNGRASIGNLLNQSFITSQ